MIFPTFHCLPRDHEDIDHMLTSVTVLMALSIAQQTSLPVHDQPMLYLRTSLDPKPTQVPSMLVCVLSIAPESHVDAGARRHLSSSRSQV